MTNEDLMNATYSQAYCDVRLNFLIGLLVVLGVLASIGLWWLLSRTTKKTEHYITENYS